MMTSVEDEAERSLAQLYEAVRDAQTHADLLHLDLVGIRLEGALVEIHRAMISAEPPAKSN